MMNASSSNASFREASKPRLLDQVRDKCRLLHYSKRTERAYVDWIRRFILFHGKRHPREMGKGEKDRCVPRPDRVKDRLREQIERVPRLHAQDVARGYGRVWLPYGCVALLRGR
jgi:hypothetical protein